MWRRWQRSGRRRSTSASCRSHSTMTPVRHQPFLLHVPLLSQCQSFLACLTALGVARSRQILPRARHHVPIVLASLRRLQRLIVQRPWRPERNDRPAGEGPTTCWPTVVACAIPPPAIARWFTHHRQRRLHIRVYPLMAGCPVHVVISDARRSLRLLRHITSPPPRHTPPPQQFKPRRRRCRTTPPDMRCLAAMLVSAGARSCLGLQLTSQLIRPSRAGWVEVDRAAGAASGDGDLAG